MYKISKFQNILKNFKRQTKANKCIDLHNKYMDLQICFSADMSVLLKRTNMENEMTILIFNKNCCICRFLNHYVKRVNLS